MGFFDPTSLWLGLSLAVLIGIYLRDRTRTTLEVSSISLFDLTTAPVLRSRILRLDALFWLEAAALVALTLLGAGLYLREAAPAVQLKRHALIFNLGASMGARSHDATRLEEAENKALALVNATPAGHRFSVIGYGFEAKVERAETDQKAVVRASIKSLDALAVTPGEAALGAAFTAAGDAEEIDLFTDHSPAASFLRDAGARASIRVHLVGIPGSNLAIVSIDPGVPRSVEGNCLIRSFATSPETTKLTIDVDGIKVFDSALTLAPRSQEVVRFGPLPQGGVVQAHLTPVDDLAADNYRYAIAAPVTPAKALVVSNDRSVRDDLGRILLAVNPAFRVIGIENSEAALRGQRGVKFDLALFHESDPKGIDSAAKLLVFPTPPMAASMVPVIGTVAMAELRRRVGSAPLATPVLLGPARILALPNWMEPLANGAAAGDDAGFPLIATGVTSAGKIGVVAFDVRRHLLLDADKMEVLLVAIEGIRRLLQSPYVKIVSTGDFVTAPSFGSAKLIAPDGSQSRLIADSSGLTHFRPMQVGRYLVVTGRKVIAIYANYYDAQESDLTIGTGEPKPSPIADAPGPRRLGTRPIGQERMLALVVLAALLMESWLLRRRSVRGSPVRV